MSFSRLVSDTTSYSSKSNRRFYRKSRKDALPVSIAILLSVTVSLLAFSKLQSIVPIPNSLSALSLPITSRVSSKYPKGFCDGDPKYITNNRFSLFLLLPGVLFSFVGLAIVTDDYFVPSLESICDRLHLSEDVAGATFMAAGSSAPELFTSLLGVFVTKDDVGVGTIVGSAVFNILVIIGLSGALAGATLCLDWRPLMRDSAFYFLSIVLLLLFVLPITKGRADWWEGLILVVVYLGYILFMKFGNKPYMKHTEKWVRDLPPTDPLSQAESAYSNLTPRAAFRAAGNAVIAMNRLRSNSSASGDIPSIDANRSSQISAPESQRRSFLGVELPKTRMQKIAFPFTFPWRLIFHWTVPNCTREGWKKWWPVTFSNSIIWIMGISYIMVEAARLSGCLIGIPAPVMGLTVLAAGTSVPDALASVAVARAGRGNMAVSNAIGSNVFDILLGLGLPWFLGGLIKRDAIRVQVEPIGVVVIPIVILFAILFILIIIFLLLRWKLSRPLGFILFGLYGVFVIYQLLEVFVLKIGEKK